MGIKRNTIIIAEVLNVKPSRMAADAAMQQVERLLQDNVRPTASKPKAGRQGLRGRVRVDRSKRWDVEAVEETLSWGYVQPRGVVTAHRDEFTVGVVVGSGASVESPDLPEYYFHYIEEGRNYRVIRK